MGLDDVEIYMDLEDKFQIPFHPDISYKGQVGYLIEYFQDRFNAKYFDDQLNKISSYIFDNPNNISRKEYNEFAKFMGWPNATWFNPNRNPGTKDKIIIGFKEKIKSLNMNESVSVSIKQIIADRLKIKHEILDTHNLYKDLGAG